MTLNIKQMGNVPFYLIDSMAYSAISAILVS